MDGLGWPLISKPRIGRGGRGIAVHENASTLEGLNDEHILQEFIPSDEYAPNVYRSGGKSLAIVLKKTSLKQGIVGNALSVERVYDPEIANLAINAAKAIGLTGPIDMDIRRRIDGPPVILDINARFGANIAFAPEVLDAVLEGYLC
jgi:carbamoylphosphate synthase large subunit